MLSKQEFLRVSIEINLFFQRIMKEHLFFLETNLQPVNPALITEAKVLKKSFEQLLAETVYYANGYISEYAIGSNEFVTPYTLRAEEVNSLLTGAEIDTEITKTELRLISDRKFENKDWLDEKIRSLNSRSYNLLEEVIDFQNRLLAAVSQCKIFITLYHEMLEHDTREAMYYLEILRALQNRTLPRKELCDELNFWNNIMGEHAQFIDGMLDPTERSLKDTAENFSKRFEKLVEICIRTGERQIMQNSLEATERIRDFKRSSTEGLLKCNIKSIIPPLLADHILREANHYLRLLKMMRK